MKATQNTNDVHVLAVNVIRLNINGTSTYYTVREWIEDINHPDGGCYQRIKHFYKTPRVDIDFLAKIDIKLEVGSIYTDGVNDFLATSEHEITNCNKYLETFTIPKEIICVYKPYVL